MSITSDDTCTADAKISSSSSSRSSNFVSLSNNGGDSIISAILMILSSNNGGYMFVDMLGSAPLTIRLMSIVLLLGSGFTRGFRMRARRIVHWKPIRLAVCGLRVNATSRRSVRFRCLNCFLHFRARGTCFLQLHFPVLYFIFICYRSSTVIVNFLFFSPLCIHKTNVIISNMYEKFLFMVTVLCILFLAKLPRNIYIGYNILLIFNIVYIFLQI